MIVHEHDCCRRQLKRPFHHFAHIDRSMIDRAGLLHLIGDDLVAFVEEQDAELGQAIDPKSVRPKACPGKQPRLSNVCNPKNNQLKR